MGAVILALASGPSWYLLLPFDNKEKNRAPGLPVTIRTLNTPFFTPGLTVSKAKGYHDLPLSVMAPSRGGWTLVGDVHTIDYSRTPLFRTR